MSPSAAETASAASFAALLDKLDYLEEKNIKQVRAAYKLADKAHLGQTRKSGEPYITHPIAVAAQCAEWKLDTTALMAALLHDTMEDCGVSKLDLAKQFGTQVAELVDGLTKLDKLRFSSRQENQAESFRKMLLAMANDVRVILIKLADRIHNMRTMSDMKRSAQIRISTETLEIYAPIANRLGLNNTYRELEDLSFRYLHPWRYVVLEHALKRSRKRRNYLVEEVQQTLENSFSAAGLRARITSREKGLYSIYRKMDMKRHSFSQINDIYAFRILVSSNLDCYLALGILHQLYRPVPQRLKDFIAIPKDNGYQSLHTTLIGPAGVHIEFQIRTESMHQVAETGVAAHWMYKTQTNITPNTQTNPEQPANWLRNLLDIQKETLDSQEFFDHVRLNLFPEDVFVFTPKNHIMSLPRGATAVDFAYAIHSAVGDQAVACRINQQEVPLRSELKSGDIVEIITDSNSSPNPSWLAFVRTAKARARIRNHLKNISQAEAIKLGERLLTQAYRTEGIEQLPPQDEKHKPMWDELLRQVGSKSQEELFVELGQGKHIAGILAKQLAQLVTSEGLEQRNTVLQSQEHFTTTGNNSENVLTLDGSEKSSVKFSPCCHPIPGDEIVGYLGRGEGLVVHIAACPIAKRLYSKDAERFVEVEWSENMTRSFDVAITVTLHNKVGAIASVTAAIAAIRSNIAYIGTSDELYQDAIDLNLILQVTNRKHLAQVLRAIRRVPTTIRASRVRT